MSRQNPAPAVPGGFGPGLTNRRVPPEGPSQDAAPEGAAAASAGPGAPGTGRPPGAPPEQPFLGLESLWLQVAGTFCNLTCAHCFVTCGPAEDRHAMMTRAEVASRVAEGLGLGAREVYFTGGEPFLNPELPGMVEDTLALAPLTVLTNGTLFTSARVAWLAARSRAARHSLELRVSLDAPAAAGHDELRGEGAWARALAGLRSLEAAGLSPIVTLTLPPGRDEAAWAEGARAALRAEGVRADRLKLLPMFALGRQLVRLGGGSRGRSLASLPERAFDPERLQCGRSRAVTSRGVYVCPLLVDEPGGRMGGSLAEAARPFALAHEACVTCWATGMTCANA